MKYSISLLAVTSLGLQVMVTAAPTPMTTRNIQESIEKRDNVVRNVIEAAEVQRRQNPAAVYPFDYAEKTAIEKRQNPAAVYPFDYPEKTAAEKRQNPAAVYPFDYPENAKAEKQ